MTIEHDAHNQDSIGICWMNEDGTIVLQLRAQAPGMRGDAVLEYLPEQAEYAEILAHVGPLQPGERKPVAPFPD